MNLTIQILLQIPNELKGSTSNNTLYSSFNKVAELEYGLLSKCWKNPEDQLKLIIVVYSPTG